MSSAVQSRDEVRALSRLAFEELRGAAGGIGGVHRAVAGRVFSSVPFAPARLVHDAVTTGSYAAVRGAFGLAGLAADAALGRRPLGGVARPLSATPKGATMLGILNGLRGDALEAEGNPLAQPMAVRVDGEPVALEPEALRAAFPSAGPRVVVFLHGLMETEVSWGLGAGPEGETYGTRLERELGWTPVYVRFNSGRRISHNGRSLEQLLDELVAAWPVRIDELALVGHSMGGLIARSACHHGAETGRAWVPLVRHTVSLGTPHHGAPLEQVVHAAAAMLSAVPETRPFGGFLRRRSGGIRDLHQGSLVDEDWHGRDPDALRVAACREIPLLDGATHCFVSGSITRSPRHPVGRLIGDMLVLEPSASGRTRRLPFADGAHVGGATHFALLNHPAVYERLRGWLA